MFGELINDVSSYTIHHVKAKTVLFPMVPKSSF